MKKPNLSDKTLTIQVHHESLNPRTFRVPIRWIRQASVLAWVLLAVSILSSVFAIRGYLSNRSARPELISELENEVQELKGALEKKVESSKSSGDPKALTEKPAPAPGEKVEGKEGIWAGLAENITLPPPGVAPSVRLEDAKMDWQGKYVNFTVNIVFHDPGKGSQQGHLITLGRASDRLFAHPDGVLNTQSASFLVDPNRGEYFSVARFRTLNSRFGPFESTDQLAEIQVYLFDLNNKLILNQVFHNGK